LTPHERSRGYVYVSKDAAVNEILDVNCFIAEVVGKSFPNRRLDVSGRVHIPKTQLDALGDGEVKIKVVSRTLLVITKMTKK